MGQGTLTRTHQRGEKEPAGEPHFHPKDLERSEVCKTQGVASAPSPFIVLLGQITPLPNPQVATGARAGELLEVKDRLGASGSFSSSLWGGGGGWSSAILCPSLCWEAVGGLEGKGLSLLPPPVYPRCPRDVGRGGPTRPSHSCPCRAPDSLE